ncbi:hypothetical protein ACHWQZ_G003255 [Mnemiopsis leidyi]
MPNKQESFKDGDSVEEKILEDRESPSETLVPPSNSDEQPRTKHGLLIGGGMVFLVISLVSITVGCVYFYKISTVTKTRTKSYSFETGQSTKEVGGKSYIVNTINGNIPAPAVHVRKGEVLSVKVANGIAESELTVHWHGLHLRGFQVYDGVEGITQCVIKPQTSYLYEYMVDEQPGTYWYHTHNQKGLLGLDFIRGPLIIHEPDAVDIPLPGSGDSYQFGSERILFYYDLFPYYKGPGLLNGDQLHEIKVENGREYRFRIINGGDKYAYFFTIDGHELTVVATDGFPVEPYKTDVIHIHSGERFDILIAFDISTPTESLWVRAKGVSSSQKEDVLGVIRVRKDSSIPFETELPPDKNGGIDLKTAKILNCLHVEKPEHNCHGITELVSTQLPPLLDSEVHYVEVFVLGTGAMFMKIAERKFTQFYLPNIPALFTPAADRESKHASMLSVSANKSVTIVLRNQGWSDHPMHLHGHHYEVLALGTKKAPDICDENYICPLLTLEEAFSEPISDILATRRGVLKDSAILPSGGAMILRFNTDNPGVWLFHCHVKAHMLEGLTLAVNEGDYLLSRDTTPGDYPACEKSEKKKEEVTCSCSDVRSGNVEMVCARPWGCGGDN